MYPAEIEFILHLADNALVLGHRMSEWCGHAPALEQDIAMANIALDHVGQSRMYYQLAAELIGDGKTEDDLAYLRDVREYRNYLLLEQENEDFAYTIARSFYFDHYNYLFLELLLDSSHGRLADIAGQAIKEVKYHCRFSAEWIRRLGDGTELSHEKIQKALNDLYTFTGEFFIDHSMDEEMAERYRIDKSGLKELWEQTVFGIMKESTLVIPKDDWFQQGGKDGMHTEKLGYLLAEMQFMQRAYPNMSW